jgi:hypothetical protein
VRYHEEFKLREAEIKKWPGPKKMSPEEKVELERKGLASVLKSD